MLNMRLEDQVGDVLKKFRYGRKMGLRETAGLAEIDPEILREIEAGGNVPEPGVLIALGRALGFDGKAMATLHLHPENTPDVTLPGHATGIEEHFGGYRVWCTLVRHREDPERALLFDTGGGGAILADSLRKSRVRVEGVLLTHGHEDHGGGFSGALSSPGTPVLLRTEDLSLLPEIRSFSGPLLDPDEGCRKLRSQGWPVTVTRAPGHTPGSVAYLIDGILLVGDTIFCGSAGRCFAPETFSTLLSSIRSLVGNHGPDTLIRSGHGPLTTVGRERETNPFVRVRETLSGDP